MADKHLEALGLTRWEERKESSRPAAAAESQGATESEFPAQTLAQESIVNSDKWRELCQQVETCTRCELHQTRKQTVFGVGNEGADLMLVGEAPGADEDEQGEPFVGKAGQLLNNMLAAIGFQRDDVFIANILKCRPPGNANPTPEQAGQCQEYLHAQINLIKPKVILALGAVAVHYLLNVEKPVGTLRGQTLPMPKLNVPVLPTYHPAYLLRKPSAKREAFEDLLLLCKVLEGTGESSLG